MFWLLYILRKIKDQGKTATLQPYFPSEGTDNLKDKFFFMRIKSAHLKRPILRTSDLNRMNLDSIARLEREFDSGICGSVLEGQLILLRVNCKCRSITSRSNAEGKMA